MIERRTIYILRGQSVEEVMVLYLVKMRRDFRDGTYSTISTMQETRP